MERDQIQKELDKRIDWVHGLFITFSNGIELETEIKKVLLDDKKLRLYTDDDDCSFDMTIPLEHITEFIHDVPSEEAFMSNFKITVGG